MSVSKEPIKISGTSLPNSEVPLLLQSKCENRYNCTKRDRMGAMEEYLAGYSKDWWEEAKRNRILVREYNTIDPTDLEGK